MRITPNPKSMILANAVVGGAGLGSPPEITAPAGMGTVILYVPIDCVVGKTPIDIQNDIGLPWFVEDGPAIWFDEM
jgi:hypothetical protein